MNERILIIDDNPDLRDNASELLELSGYQVFTAINGKDGLEKAREVKPDLILCDIMMPELDGYGVLRAIGNLSELASTPFIYVTAKTEKGDFRKGMDLGADDYLTKPFEGDDLLRVVEARLKKKRLAESKSTPGEMKSAFGNAGSIEDILRLSSKRAVKKLRPKDMVYMEGDTANFLYYVVSGRIRIYRTNEWGKEYITWIHGPGEFFGFHALLDASEHKQSAMAMDDSEISLIPKQDFFDLLFSSSTVAMAFIKIISSNMNETEEKLLRLAYNSARKRVAEALLLISRKYNEEGKKDKPFPGFRENISAIAGISSESVSRNLTDFREEGLIDTINGDIIILDRKKLENLKG